MKHAKLSILVGIVILLSFWTSICFYRQNAVELNTQATGLFLKALKAELHEQLKTLNMPYFSSGVIDDTIPLTIYITTAKGERIYKVNPEESKKNISQNMNARSLHSILCSQGYLSADTLYESWVKMLKKQKIYAKAAVQIKTTDYDNKTSLLIIGDNSCTSSSDVSFTYYIGNRCECEMTGFLSYSWWAVCWYYFFPFAVIMGMASICILFFCYLFVMRKRLFKTQMLKERLLNEREQEKEKREKVEEVQKEFARRIDELEKVKKSGVEPLIYRLSSELTFHAYKKLLVWNGGQTILLSSQNTILLTAFLEAPECTLSYDELFKCLWPDGSGNMSRLRVAVGRLRDALKVDPGISILQHDVDRYQLFLPENS